MTLTLTKPWHILCTVVIDKLSRCVVMVLLPQLPATFLFHRIHFSVFAMCTVLIPFQPLSLAVPYNFLCPFEP